MTAPAIDQSAVRDISNENAQIQADKRANRAAESALRVKKLDALRERYTGVFGQCQDPERCSVARELFKAAAIFERDARHFPKRANKAIDALALAVFMLESKVASCWKFKVTLHPRIPAVSE